MYQYLVSAVKPPIRTICSVTGTATSYVSELAYVPGETIYDVPHVTFELVAVLVLQRIVIESCLPDCKYGPRVKVCACKSTAENIRVAIKKTTVLLWLLIFINWIFRFKLSPAYTLAYRIFRKSSKTNFEIKAEICSIFSKKV